MSVVARTLGYAIVGPLSAAIGERQTMGYAAALLAVASFGPLAVPAVINLRLPPMRVQSLPEQESDAAAP